MRFRELKPKNGSHIVLEERGDVIEGYHRAHVAVVNKRGDMLFHSGDPRHYTFSRSCIKPIQAIPILSLGAADHFGFDEKEIAIICGSHSGQDEHVKTIGSILKKAGLEEDQLKCGGHAPFHKGTAKKLCGEYSRIHDNCSAKHAGVLALCKHLGWPLDNYTDPDSEVQRTILETVSTLGEMDPGTITVAKDGCSIPNFAFPIDRMALMFAKLGDPTDSQFQRELTTIRRALIENPHMVSGTDRFDEVIMKQRPSEIISKAGAMGLQTVAARIKGEWLGISAKIEDGSYAAVTPLIYHILEELGMEFKDNKYSNKTIKTRSKEIVGSYKVIGSLEIGDRQPNPFLT